jgi:hypothetical protein
VKSFKILNIRVMFIKRFRSSKRKKIASRLSKKMSGEYTIPIADIGPPDVPPLVLHIVDPEGYVHIVQAYPQELVQKVLDIYDPSCSLQGCLITPHGESMRPDYPLQTYNICHGDFLEFRVFNALQNPSNKGV